MWGESSAGWRVPALMWVSTDDGVFDSASSDGGAGGPALLLGAGFASSIASSSSSVGIGLGGLAG